MSKTLNPLLAPENRANLMTNGMLKIDALQKKMIEDAKKLISQVDIEQIKKTFEHYQADIQPAIEQAQKAAAQSYKALQVDKNTQKMINDTLEISKQIQNEVLNRNEIIDYLKSKKDEFAKKYLISNIALFGSYARGENTKDSDIDIAIETKLTDYFRLYDFKEELENVFHTHVDIIRMRDRMNESLKKRIKRDGIYV